MNGRKQGTCDRPYRPLKVVRPPKTSLKTHQDSGLGGRRVGHVGQKEGAPITSRVEPRLSWNAQPGVRPTTINYDQDGI